MYIPFTSLNVGFSNAENYQRRENKELLARYFVRDEFLDRLLDPNIFYVIGEKGTGKTAYATYLLNSSYRGHDAAIYDVQQTEYRKFIELKTHGHLVLSDYSEVWRVILLMAAATTILSVSGTPEFLKRFTKLHALKKAIDEFYENAFAPEIVRMMSFVEFGEISSSLVAKHLGLEGAVSAKKGGEIGIRKRFFRPTC